MLQADALRGPCQVISQFRLRWRESTGLGHGPCTRPMVRGAGRWSRFSLAGGVLLVVVCVWLWGTARQSVSITLSNLYYRLRAGCGLMWLLPGDTYGSLRRDHHLSKIKPPAEAAEAMLARLRRYARTDGARPRGYIRGGVANWRGWQVHHPGRGRLVGLFIRVCTKHGLDFQERMLAWLEDPSEIAFWPIAITYLGEMASTPAIPLLRNILDSHETRSRLTDQNQDAHIAGARSSQGPCSHRHFRPMGHTSTVRLVSRVSGRCAYHRWSSAQQGVAR